MTPAFVAVMPDAVRRAQAMPQVVHDLVFAQAGGLGDLNGRVFARQRGGADPRQGSTGLQRLEFAQRNGLWGVAGVPADLLSPDARIGAARQLITFRPF
jgi:hypothetical protein